MLEQMFRKAYPKAPAGGSVGNALEVLRCSNRRALSASTRVEEASPPIWAPRVTGFPRTQHDVIEDFCKKTEEHACFAHVDHYIPYLPDDPFHFVAMIGVINCSFGFALKKDAKEIYVGQVTHDAIVEIAKEILSRVKGIYA